ncbi:MAG: hypothetical protein LBM77_00975 [Spirochaetaceae bacterium]|jgi:hypothetical protein|nr:hypothetical protein [Spirochaetaceae bacterium]
MPRTIEEIDNERQKVFDEYQQRTKIEEEGGPKFGDKGHYEAYLKSLENEEAEASYQMQEQDEGMEM